MCGVKSERASVVQCVALLFIDMRVVVAMPICEKSAVSAYELEKSTSVANGIAFDCVI